ncbi:CapA family protein [Patescibacteria group bacterium]|nr:CapA family protein [Patescibacteria group bacterium]
MAKKKRKSIYILYLVIIAIAGFIVYGIVIKGDDGSSVAETVAPKEVAENTSFAKEEPEQVVKEPVKTTLVAGGDIMLSRHVGTKIRQAGDNSLPFRRVVDMFSKADIAFANLESPFYDQGPPVTEGMVFKAEPETVDGLKLAGFDMVSLANNHFGNQGRSGMKYTYNHLDEHGIEYCGAGMDYDEAHTASVIEKDGISFAFLCYNGIPPESYGADEETAGLAWAQESTDEVVRDVKKAKETADVVIVSMHHGTEYTPKPAWEQKAIAHAAIDAGAETVIGHHPHVVQEVEKYNDKLIVYSLGNLVFDQMWSRETQEGVIGTYQFVDGALEEIAFQAVIIEDYNQPRFASESEEVPILKRMGLQSSVLN